VPDIGGFRLDDEQRKWVHGCLKKADIPFGERFDLDGFVSRIEGTIDQFRRAVPRRIFREEHDALREIWLLTHKTDPNPARMRRLLSRLGRRARLALDCRAEIVIPRLFPGESVKGGFLAWAKQAENAKLVTALEALSADGGEIVKGRSRGEDKRSRPRLEPRVLGFVRGSAQRQPKGGRPSEDARQQLVMFLACDWQLATGQTPAVGRSDKSGFGDLVHSVFQWLEISDDPTEAATYALRRYRDEVKQES